VERRLQKRRDMRHRLALCIVVLVACRGRHSGPMARTHAAVTPSRPASEPFLRGGGDGDDDEGGSSRKSGQGKNKWKDTGVYVDGQPRGVLGFGELPIALKPVWVADRVSTEIEPGTKGPGFAVEKERSYRFSEYLAALGVDLRRVKEVQISGPHFSETTVVTGAELRSKRAAGFLFRFGGIVGGKAIPIVPAKFGNGMKPDKISLVCVYVDKKPPKVGEEGLELDGHMLTGVPYYGEPLRGGVRVYEDDQLRLVIKRPLLRDTEPSGKGPDGALRWALLPLLKENGVDTGKIVEAWVIRDERRKEKLGRAELERAWFEQGRKHDNKIYLGDGKVPAQAIALHARALGPDDLPQILPGEE
jgi:hypothetical protein